MGKISKLDIQFENALNVCFSGEVIKGSVIVELNGTLKTKGIRLRFLGYARVHWIERYSSGTGKNKRTVTKHFDADELYFDHSAYVFGANEAEVHYLPKGTHAFPFEFSVPAGCPTTYEGSIGRVRSYVSATLEKLWVADISTLKPFTVINPLDLNNDHRTKEKSEAVNEATLCCLCCKSGPLSIKVSVENTGYVPGEAIPIRTKVLNFSKRKIRTVKALLHMNVRYHSLKKTKTHQNVVASMKRNVSKSDEVDVLEDKLLIPSLPPSFLYGCKIIDISYILEIIIQPSGIAFEVPVRIELIIGTLPLKKSVAIPSKSNIPLNPESKSPNLRNNTKNMSSVTSNGIEKITNQRRPSVDKDKVVLDKTKYIRRRSVDTTKDGSIDKQTYHRRSSIDKPSNGMDKSTNHRRQSVDKAHDGIDKPAFYRRQSVDKTNDSMDKTFQRRRSVDKTNDGADKTFQRSRSVDKTNDGTDTTFQRRRSVDKTNDGTSKTFQRRQSVDKSNNGTDKTTPNRRRSVDKTNDEMDKVFQRIQSMDKTKDDTDKTSDKEIIANDKSSGQELNGDMTFVESVLGKVKIEDEDDFDKVVYTPMYPYFNVHHSKDIFCVDIPP